MKTTDKRYEDLANAIILQAIADWKHCYLDENGEYAFPRNKSVNRKEIESFFRSKWFACLSNVDPEYILELLRGEEKCS